MGPDGNTASFFTGKLISGPDGEIESDRVQDRSTYHPGVIIGEECEAHRPSDHKAGQKTPVASEVAHERLSHHHESEVLFAKDFSQHITGLPEVDVRLGEVKLMIYRWSTRVSH